MSGQQDWRVYQQGRAGFWARQQQRGQSKEVVRVAVRHPHRRQPGHLRGGVKGFLDSGGSESRTGCSSCAYLTFSSNWNRSAQVMIQKSLNCLLQAHRGSRREEATRSSSQVKPDLRTCGTMCLGTGNIEVIVIE